MYHHMADSIEQFWADFLTRRGTTESRSGDGGSGFEFALQREGAVLYILMRGELEFRYTVGFNEAVDAALAEPMCREVVFHMGKVSFVDSTGLACIVNASQVVRGREGRVHLAECSPFVLRTLDITRLKRVFVIHDTFPDACAAAANEPGDGTA